MNRNAHAMIEGAREVSNYSKPFVVEDTLVNEKRNGTDVFAFQGVLNRRYRRFCRHRNDHRKTNQRLVMRSSVEQDDVLTMLLGDDIERLSVFYGASSLGGGILLMQPFNGEKRLCVAGDFNQWSMQSDSFHFHQQHNVWYWFYELQAGKHEYRLVVDGQWSEDLFNRNRIKNKFNGWNHLAWCY